MLEAKDIVLLIKELCCCLHIISRKFKAIIEIVIDIPAANQIKDFFTHSKSRLCSIFKSQISQNKNSWYRSVNVKG